MKKYSQLRDSVSVKTHLGRPWEDCQQAVVDEFPRMLTALFGGQMYVIGF